MDQLPPDISRGTTTVISPKSLVSPFESNVPLQPEDPFSLQSTFRRWGGRLGDSFHTVAAHLFSQPHLRETTSPLTLPTSLDQPVIVQLKKPVSSSITQLMERYYPHYSSQGEEKLACEAVGIHFTMLFQLEGLSKDTDIALANFRLKPRSDETNHLLRWIQDLPDSLMNEWGYPNRTQFKEAINSLLIESTPLSQSHSPLFTRIEQKCAASPFWHQWLASSLDNPKNSGGSLHRPELNPELFTNSDRILLELLWQLNRAKPEIASFIGGRIAQDEWTLPKIEMLLRHFPAPPEDGTTELEQILPFVAALNPEFILNPPDIIPDLIIVKWDLCGPTGKEAAQKLNEAVKAEVNRVSAPYTPDIFNAFKKRPNLTFRLDEYFNYLDIICRDGGRIQFFDFKTSLFRANDHSKHTDQMGYYLLSLAQSLMAYRRKTDPSYSYSQLLRDPIIEAFDGAYVVLCMANMNKETKMSDGPQMKIIQLYSSLKQADRIRFWGQLHRMRARYHQRLALAIAAIEYRTAPPLIKTPSPPAVYEPITSSAV